MQSRSLFFLITISSEIVFLPAPTPQPGMAMEVTVVQQDIGVQLYALTYPEGTTVEDLEGEDAVEALRTPFHQHPDECDHHR